MSFGFGFNNQYADYRVHDDPDDDDYYEDDEEYGDEEDDDDDDEYGYGDDDMDEDNELGIMANMSPNLMAALGLDVSHVKIESDWKPPEKAGLDNSLRLVDEINFKNALYGGSEWNQYDTDVDVQMSRFFKYMRGSDSYFKDINRKKLQDLYEHKHESKYDSKHADSDNDMDTESDEDDEEEEEERNVYLSPNLAKLLGLDSSKVEVEQYGVWQSPQTHGLQNSEVIADVDYEYVTKDKKIVRLK